MVIWDRDASIRRDPLNEIERLSRRMNRLFGPARMSGMLDSFPPVNIWSGSEKAVVTAELPGIQKEDLDISVENDVLTIKGHRAPEEIREGESFRRHERGHGSFHRTVTLPFTVDPESINAEYNHGVLRLELPRHEASKPKKIAVS